MSGALAIARHRNSPGWAVRSAPAMFRQPVVIRAARPADADAIHQLIVEHAAEGRLLARTVDEIAGHADRFVVACQGTVVVGCVDLTPLSSATAEIRSLVVDRSARSNGVGRLLLDELTVRADQAGFDMLCAFTHAPGYFVHAGFSVVPHAWIPEKITRDCRGCAQFRACGQYAVVRPLAMATSRIQGVYSGNG